MFNKWKLTIILASLAVLICLIFVIIETKAPADFPVKTIYHLETGIGLNKLSLDLKDNQIIKSPFLFKVFSVLFGGPRGIMAGDYVLTDPQTVIGLAWRFSHGEFDLTPVRITFPEGLNVFEISKLISQKFPKIKAEDFIAMARTSEGYLFPDTYLFLPNVQVKNIVETMEDNYNQKIKTLSQTILNFGKPSVDIIKMASLVEEEAQSFTAKQIVAGILWKRLSLNMPLQVDSSFKYINGKTTATLTLADLKIDSPYNSYLYKGLPPTPISNPGLETIRATITPIKTDYLYFLTDKKGGMHYAKTYTEHLTNKARYL